MDEIKESWIKYYRKLIESDPERQKYNWVIYESPHAYHCSFDWIWEDKKNRPGYYFIETIEKSNDI